MLDLRRVDLHIVYMLVPIVLLLFILGGPIIAYAVALAAMSFIALLYLAVHVADEIKMQHDWKQYLLVNTILVILVDAVALGLHYVLMPSNR